MNTFDLPKTGKEWISQVREHLHPRRKIEHPLVAEGSALLVIDMQRYFTEPASHAFFPEVDAIIENVQKIIAAFRAQGLPVIFTRHAVAEGEDPGLMGRWWGEVIALDDPLSAIDVRVGPIAGEPVIRKARYSAFLGTDLERMLGNMSIARLVIVGVMTHLCCESTARDAFMRDFQVFFVADATATDDVELHLGSLRALADGFAILVITEEVKRWL